MQTTPAVLYSTAQTLLQEDTSCPKTKHKSVRDGMNAAPRELLTQVRSR